MKVERTTLGGNLVGTWEEGDCALVLAHVKRDSDGKTVAVQIGDTHIEDLPVEYTIAFVGFPHDNDDLRPLTYKPLLGASG